MQKSEEAFTVHYDGPGLKTGVIDVRILAPSLLAFTDTVRDAQKLVSPDSPAPRIDVKATDKGSFIADLIVNTSILETLLDALNSNQTNAVLNGSGIVAIVLGAIRVIKNTWAKGKAKSQRLPDGKVRLTYPDGTEDVISTEVAAVAQDIATRKSLLRFVGSLDSDEVDEVTIQTATDQETITRNDIPAFALPVSPDEQKTDTTRRVIVWVNQPTLLGDYVWRFDDDRGTFTAKMEDEQFISSMERGDEPFVPGDQLDVDLREVQFVRSDGTPRTARYITKVWGHSTPGKQGVLSLFGDEDEPESSEL